MTMKRRTSRWKEHATDLAFDLAGSFLMGVGVYTFALKGGFATGGLSGMALIINYLWGLPVGMVTLALNVPLVLLTWRTLGRGFFLKSLRTMVVSTLIIDFVLPLFPVYEGSRLLAAGFSGVLMGAGLSLIYMRGSSTGGSDFLIHAAKRKAPTSASATSALPSTRRSSCWASPPSATSTPRFTAWSAPSPSPS